MKNPNGYGSITKLSGNRRKPYLVRAAGEIDAENVKINRPIIGTFATRKEAMNALAEYNLDPYDISKSSATFSQVYAAWFDRKYNGVKKYSKSSIACTKGAYKKCSALHNLKITDIRTKHMQDILDNFELSHAYMEHIRNLFNQVFKYALELDYIKKNYAAFLTINKEDDDESGVPFTQEELDALWKNKDKPYVDTILILMYSGWRINELLGMPTDNIDLDARTYTGGLKTDSGKNRVVPIHSKIYDMVSKRVANGYGYLFDYKGRALTNSSTYYKCFNKALASCGILTKHTPHDCRHTFATLLDNAGANSKSIKMLLGHSSGNDVTEKIYTHKDIAELRKAIELI